jgi:hypothetical protein
MQDLPSTYKNAWYSALAHCKNELASATIDQERMMKAIAKADEKKRKRMMPGSADSGSSNGAPPKYHMVYTPLEGQLRRPQQQQNWGNRQ